MYYYFSVDDVLVLCQHPLNGLAIAPAEALNQVQRAVFVYHRDSQHNKASFCPSHVAQLFLENESTQWLSTQHMDAAATNWSVPHQLIRMIAEGRIKAVNGNIDGFADLFSQEPVKKQRLNLLALGDVGSTLAIGLRLLGGDVLSEIGIYDVRPEVCRRWEFELNQIAAPGVELPPVRIVDPESLFTCDMFVFCASIGVPPLNAGVQDVRMAQLEANGKLLRTYAKAARNAAFRGMFAVVSDPVDQLCSVAFSASNEDDEGCYDGKGLRPEQIQGYGLGVMAARAAYYAQKENRFSAYQTQGRAYGPHGAQLVIADSIDQYNHGNSLELTHLAVEANLRMRELGYKPYVAPALSSGALSLLAALRHSWHYSATFLGGAYFGARNRQTENGVQLEHCFLPDQLFARIQTAYRSLLP